MPRVFHIPVRALYANSFFSASVNWKLSVRLVVNSKKPARNSDSRSWIRRRMASARNERDMSWKRMDKIRMRGRTTSQWQIYRRRRRKRLHLLNLRCVVGSWKVSPRQGPGKLSVSCYILVGVGVMLQGGLCFIIHCSGVSLACLGFCCKSYGVGLLVSK